MDAPPIVTARGVFKDFVLPHERHSSLKQAAINVLRRPTYERLRVLEDVSFEIHAGEFFGIVGRNGSGKSTILKILAGIYVPTSGEVHVGGRLAPFIDLGVGFNPELTGRNNVFLNGAIFGMSRAELVSRYDEIVEYAELGQFMDQKLKNYSSGMQVRLAFSIAIRADADIIIMDEVLAVGDASFQEKCFDSFRALKAQGKTIILVTHEMSNVVRFCDRVLVLDRGVTYGVMSASDAAHAYSRLNEQSGWQAAEVSFGDGRDAIPLEVELRDNDGGARASCEPHEPLLVAITVAAPEDDRGATLQCRVTLERMDGFVIAEFSSAGSVDVKGAAELLLTIAPPGLTSGRYRISAAVDHALHAPTTVAATASTTFTIAAAEDSDALLALPATWVRRSFAGVVPAPDPVPPAAVKRSACP